MSVRESETITRASSRPASPGLMSLLGGETVYRDLPPHGARRPLDLPLHPSRRPRPTLHRIGVFLVDSAALVLATFVALVVSRLLRGNHLTLGITPWAVCCLLPLQAAYLVHGLYTVEQAHARAWLRAVVRIHLAALCVAGAWMLIMGQFTWLLSFGLAIAFASATLPALRALLHLAVLRVDTYGDYRLAAELRNLPAHPELYPPTLLRRVIAKERERCDRAEAEFCVASFYPRRPTARRVSRLTRLLVERTRLTDDAGLLENGHVAVLLHETGVKGAWLFADSIAQRGRLARTGPLEIHLYHYAAGDTTLTEVGRDDDDDADPHGPDVAGRLGPAAPVPAAPSAESARRVNCLRTLLTEPTPRWKRVLDVVGASVGLLATAPVLLGAMLAVKLTSRGPALFKQPRAGLGGKPFVCYKLRTMVVDAEARKAALRALSEQDGPAFKIKRDPRVTPIGRFLRKTSIDELPQFWNVLKGEMSLVGPRPLPVAESDGCHGWQRRRLEVVPGLTCIWQVKGRSRVSFVDWVRMDMNYIRTRSVWVDLKLIAQTVPSVLFSRGAS